MAKHFSTVLVLLMSLCQWSLAQALSLNGVTQFASTYNLNSATSGIVVSVKVKPGQRVKKDQLLIELDTTPHKARLSRAMASEKSLLPDVEISQLELERVQELYDIDSLSQVDLKNAENKLIRAEGAYQVAQAETALARYQLEHSTIRAPVDGRVIQINTNNFEYIDPAEDARTLITLVESRRMNAIAMIGSDQWNANLLNKQATIQYRNKSFNGRVSFIGVTNGSPSANKVAYTLHVSFETDRLIPAQMPVLIDIKE